MNMFERHDDTGYRQAPAGVDRKTLVYGEKTLMTEFRLKADSVLPRHAHPQEQTGYLVKGQLRLFIGAESHEVRPGDSWCIPGGVEHGADILEDSVAVEVFSPVRQDYLPSAVDPR
jgi:quercetin dioxygenase-like cupin family protein